MGTTYNYLWENYMEKTYTVRVTKTKLYLEILIVVWIKWTGIVEIKYKDFINVFQNIPCQNL